ncbi:MAG: O-antigen ligase family protein [Bacteroidales bacterium]|nr:O-antigen ligase family protein [Bacteroidales bacterium]
MKTGFSISREEIHFQIYYWSLTLLVVCMPVSRYLMTVSLAIIVANWLAQGKFKTRFRIFLADRPAVAFTLIYSLSIIGLLWTKDINYALSRDLLHKSPMLFLPIIFATSRVPDARKTRLILILFIASVFIVTITGFVIRTIHPGASFREASPFIAGVYLSILIIIAAFQLPLLASQTRQGKIIWALTLAVTVWLFFFLIYLRSLSGIASLAGIILFLSIMFISKRRSLYSRLAVSIVIVAIASAFILPVIKIYRQTHMEIETDFSTLDEYTALGNRYYHDTVTIARENGHLINIYIAEEELKEAWEKASTTAFPDTTLTGSPVRTTLYRYMASKGLRKDAGGFRLMTSEDIAAVEKGVTNYLNLSRSGVYNRIYEELMGFYIYRKVSYRVPWMSSFAERFDQWRAAIKAFAVHPVFGWGTGSVLKAMKYGFQTTGSPFAAINMKPHNQYFWILLTLGVAGLLGYILLYTFIVVKSGVYKSFIFNIFLITFLINFLANNSIEGQLGQNPFVFFTLFYIYFYPKTQEERPDAVPGLWPPGR